MNKGPHGSGAGMLSLALGLPATVRTNAYFREKHADMVRAHEESSLARLWAKNRALADDERLFEEEMAPYLADPFRGTRERRVLGPGETGLSLQVTASRAALAAANIEKVDLVLSTAFFPEHSDVGNATYLAKELGLRCAAWNLESACASSVLAYETACALVASGVHRNVLVAVTCTYSSATADDDALSWWLGDAGAAFVVGRVGQGRGYVAGHTINTAETCGCFTHQPAEPGSARRFYMRSSAGAGPILRATAAEYLRTCCNGAAEKAGVTLADVDFFVFNTPTAWYSRYCSKILGVDPGKCTDVYPLYGNVGPALMPVTLHHAAREGKIKDDALVLLYAVGSSSSASAVIVRWSDLGGRL